MVTLRRDSLASRPAAFAEAPARQGRSRFTCQLTERSLLHILDAKLDGAQGK